MRETRGIRSSPIFSPLSLTLLISMSACGRSIVMQVDDDAIVSRQILVVALEAWKSGTPETLSERIPPIRFTDADLGAGNVLVEYAIEPHAGDLDSGSPIGVDLVLQDRLGQAVRKRINYHITLEPDLSVFRQAN